MSLAISQKKNSKFIYILLLGLLTGTLDGLSAVILTGSMNVWKYVAGGYFGKATAMAGGNDMIVYGLIFHYCIAFIFSTLFFLLHPMFYSWFRNSFLTGVVYGIIMWAIMNLAVVPLSALHNLPKTVLGSLEACGILIVALGLPISYIGTGYYFYKAKK